MKIKETRTNDAGGKGRRIETTVRELTEGDPIPAQAEAVPDETPVHDWKEEEPNN
jgi:hypothetical protein